MSSPDGKSIAFEISSQSILKVKQPSSPKRRISRKRKTYIIACKQQGLKSPTGKLNRKSVVMTKSRVINKDDLDFDGLESEESSESIG